LLPLFLKASKKINLETLTLLARSVRGMGVYWGILAGVEGALTAVPLDQDTGLFLGHIPKVLFLLSLTVVLSRISVGLFDIHAKRGKGDTPTISLFTNVIKLTVYVLGFLVILQSLGISITPVLTALGVGGLAVALALQDTLSNLFAGFQIIASGQIRAGNYVHLETGEEGYVTDVTWRNTTIRAIPNNMVIVPNSKLAGTIITNYHQPETSMNVYINLGVHYNSDLEHVERVTVEVAREVMREVEGAAADFAPYIRYHTFNDFSIDFKVVLRVDEYMAHFVITHEFVKRLHRRYNEEGITIPFPIRTFDIPDTERLRIEQVRGEDRD
ncbi:MAG: mechanosensitive ion channel family protein, partial [bacterium]